MCLEQTWWVRNTENFRERQRLGIEFKEHRFLSQCDGFKQRREKDLISDRGKWLENGGISLNDFVSLVLDEVRLSIKVRVKFKSVGNLNWFMQIDKRRKTKTLWEGIWSLRHLLQNFPECLLNLGFLGQLPNISLEGNIEPRRLYYKKVP